MSHTELIAVIIGGLFVVIVLSDVIQIGSFKATGKRVFKMAPLHHHFELLGMERSNNCYAILDHLCTVCRTWGGPVLP